VHYLKEKEVIPGLTTKIYSNDKFEGYAELIEPFGPWNSYIVNTNGPVYAKQRWLIQWIDPNEQDLDLNKEEMFTQRYLSGKRCHRNIHFEACKTWKKYWHKYGRLKKQLNRM